MNTPENDCEEVGTLLINLKEGEGSFKLDTDTHAWKKIGRIGQLDILSDWINLLQKAYSTACDKHRADFGVDIEYDEQKRVHHSTIPEGKGTQGG